jgi:hypothetical protein
MLPPLLLHARGQGPTFSTIVIARISPCPPAPLQSEYPEAAEFTRKQAEYHREARLNISSFVSE